jgi:hypothetical protein
MIQLLLATAAALTIEALAPQKNKRESFDPTR